MLTHFGNFCVLGFINYNFKLGYKQGLFIKWK